MSSENKCGTQNFLIIVLSSILARSNVLFLVLLFAGEAVLGQTQHQYYSLSTTWARSMAMGGAFTAIADNLPALLYNPANFTMYGDQRTTRLSIFLNPIGLASALQEPEELHGSEKIRAQELASMLELFIHGLAFGNRSFQIAALLGEEAPHAAFSSRQNFLDAGSYAQNQYSLFAGRAMFADRVAIGASVGVYYQDTPGGREWGAGWSYGVTLLSGNNIRIGVSYWSFPDSMTEYLIKPERLVHEAVNLGIAYKTQFGMLLAFDVRNLGEEARQPVREIHLGIEQRFLPWLALRGGYYYDRELQCGLVSAGIGLIDQNLLRPARTQLQEPDWSLQYGVRLEKQNTRDVYYHALTFLVRL